MAGALAAEEEDYLAPGPAVAQLRFRAMLARAAQETGRSRAAMLADWVANFLIPKRILLEEYFNFGLHDLTRHAGSDRTAFIGYIRNRQINRVFNAHSAGQRAFSHDKRLYGALLRGFGIAAPEIVAVAHRTLRGQDTRFIHRPAALADWLAETGAYPLFGKPCQGGASEGTISINRYDAARGMLELIEGRERAVTAFAEEVFRRYGHSGYMFMPRLRPHAALRAMAGETIGSLRLVTLMERNRPVPLYAIWKIPAVGAISDTLWRKGNMIAHVDVSDGRVLRVVQGAGFALRELEAHPQTGARLVGERLPDWRQVLDIGHKAALITPAVRMIGWDIAITDDGPVILEANGNTNHTMLQTLTGRGFLDPQMRARVAAAIARRKARARQARRRRSALNRYLASAYLKSLRDNIFKRDLT